MTGISRQYKEGDLREDGFIFKCYRKNKACISETWVSPQRFHRHKLNNALQLAKCRAKKQGVPFSISRQQIESIYPVDSLCPVLGTKMTWNGDRWTSPSLDRIDPSKGYVIDNLIWVSLKANAVKSDVDPSTLMKVAQFYLKLTEDNNE